MLKFRTTVLVMIVSLTIALLAAMPVLATEAKQTAQVFASVDINKLLSGYDKSKMVDDQLATMQTQLRQKLQLRIANKLLSDAEFKELSDISAMSNPSADDNKKKADLLQISADREKEFQSLQQKLNATDAEKARMAELQAQLDKTNSSLKDDDAAYTDQLQKKQEELVAGLKKDIEAAVESVAKKKDITMVFSKSIAQYDLVIFSNNDITDEVLKKLNKK